MDKKLNQLIQATLAKTESGAIEWDAFDSESFRTRIGAGSMHIQRDSVELSQDGEAFYPYDRYSVQISDGMGRIVTEWDCIETNPDFKVLQKLFDAARKSALKPDHVIDDMLQSLLGTVK